MSAPYKLAIFDLDGTVLNSIVDIADAINTVLVKHGYPARTLAQVCSFVGNGIRKLVERAVPTGTADREIARVQEDFNAYYGVHCTDKTAPYVGILPMLRALRAAGVKTAVLSNKAEYATQLLCKTYFAGLFDVVAGERECKGIPKKPAPDGVFEIMRACGACACETVYIGDSEVDIKTAENAGIDAILVSWGLRTTELLRKNGAKIIVDTPQALQDTILGTI